MSELMVLLQALLLIAGWLLFVRAQTELRAQAARQSLTGELEELRQTIDALLQKLAEDAARAEARIEARLRELERYTPHAPPTEPTPPTPTALPKSVDAHALNPPSPPLSRGERAGSGGILPAKTHSLARQRSVAGVSLSAPPAPTHFGVRKLRFRTPKLRAVSRTPPSSARARSSNRCLCCNSGEQCSAPCPTRAKHSTIPRCSTCSLPIILVNRGDSVWQSSSTSN